VTDGITILLRVLTNGLGAGRPIRLLCGVSLGLVARIVISVLARLHPDNLLWTTLNEYTAVWYVL